VPATPGATTTRAEASPNGGATAGAEPGGAGASSSAGSEPSSEAQGGAGDCPAGTAGEPPEDYLAELNSGARLEVRYFSAPGMPPVFAEVFDTELGVVCDFVLASDGERRCLPRSTAFSQHVGYAEAGCTQAVWQGSPACDGETAYVRRPLGCREQNEVRVLVPYAGPIYLGNPANCALSDDAPGPSSYTFGEAVAPATFAAGMLEELPGVCEATLRVVVSDDGARLPYEVIDIATGTACDRWVDGCRPKHRAHEEPNLFSDATCDTPVESRYGAWEDAPTCAPPEFIRPMVDTGTWYRPGTMPPSDLFSSLGGCHPALDDVWIGSLYELGEPVPLTALAPLETVLLGDLRLQVGATAEQAKPLLAAPLPNFELHDTELDRPCFLRQMADGSVLCIPGAPGSSSNEFNDPECTVPLRSCPDADCVGAVLYDQPVPADVCSSEPPVTGIWRVTAKATAHYRMSPGVPCYADGESTSQLWTVEAVDSSHLASASLQTAPGEDSP